MYKFLIIILVVLGLGFVVGGMGETREEVVGIDSKATPVPVVKTGLPSGGEKIEIFAFHSTQRCISCVNVGKYTQDVINQQFASEVSSGKIIFKEINIDLLENEKLVKDYQVSGSSLYITVTKDGQSIKEEDVDVWRYVSSETKFKSYFEAKIKKLQ